LRIEAGLPLIDVEWHNSRTAFTDADRVTPKELGLGWMLPSPQQDDRAFVGRQAIRRELSEGTSRWATVGIVVDWADWDRLHRGRHAARPPGSPPRPAAPPPLSQPRTARVGPRPALGRLAARPLAALVLGPRPRADRLRRGDDPHARLAGQHPQSLQEVPAVA